MKTTDLSRIKNSKQYSDYCNEHERLIQQNGDEKLISVLEVLIEDYDRRQLNQSQADQNPVELLKFFMEINDLTAAELSRKISCSRQILSDVLNYRRKLSQEMVRKLSNYFAVKLDAFGRDYDLGSHSNELADLMKLPGVNKKIARVLRQHQYRNLEDLASADAEQLRSILQDSGISKYSKIDPAKMIAESRNELKQKKS
ncbi:MAG: helix-turn-helix domain-containing protein [Bacteroidetes bacterium]|nr:helix-turn-helix domain-containing protein [Bacteroidota bacterium]